MAQTSMVPSLKENNYGEGILLLVEAFSGVLHGEVDPAVYDAEALEDSGVFLLFLVGAFFALVVGSMLRSKLTSRNKMI